MVPPPPSSSTPTPTRPRGGLTSVPPRRDADGPERAGRLFVQHHREVLRFLRRRDPDLAEDALSETFAVAVRRVDDIPEGRELPWLYVVAEHVLRNLQRTRRRAARVPEALHPLTSHATQASDVPHVGDALGELPDRERILLTMTAFEGLSATEAADRMGIPYGSARNALSSGRKRLAVMLATAAALVLVVGFIGTVVERVRTRGPIETLASSLASARVVHDVAVVSHDGTRTGGTEPRSAGSRYERWSEPSGDRTRVRLPGGDEVVAARGETLRSAASLQVSSSETPTRRRAVREDLTALDAASPAAISALLGDPLAQRTAADGPTIDGHDTTTVRGRITDAAGVEHAVRVFVADDEPTVLRVRVRPTGGAGSAVATAAATVDFAAWKATPRRAAEATTPTSPVAAAPGVAADASAATPTGDAATAGDRAASEATQTAAASGADANGKTGAQHRRAPTRPSSAPSGATATINPKLASAPIVHVRQFVKSCYTSQNSGDQCTNYGDREVWVEESGQERSRIRTRRGTGEIRNEEWLDRAQRSYFTVSPDGSRIHAMRERLRIGDVASLTSYQQGWRGAWLRTLGPQIAALQASPDRLAALPAGPDVGGYATRLFTATQSATPMTSSFDSAQPFTVEAAVDPTTGVPRRVTYRREASGARAGDLVTLEIAQWEQLPAGEHARLVAPKFPKGARVREYD